ncbi:MAG: ATP-binding protein, partial [Bacteroidales bacterium]|nr:ATP-binding protein [Bacteroidales bacterium]
TRIYSASGRHVMDGKNPENSGLIRRRPFRAPHHSASIVALAGGGPQATPGEISLAHHGVLYLDEIPEFSRQALEVLRQPLEDRLITIARSRYRVCYPANFMLVASMNPCPCGYYGESSKECSCSSLAVHRYMSRISGPLLDRIDLHVKVAALSPDELLNTPVACSSAGIRQRVIAAREQGRIRFTKDLTTFANAQMTRRHIQQHCVLDPTSAMYLKQCIQSLGLSARAYDRILKVARTIADLDKAPAIGMEHLAEAVQYRVM